MPNKKSFRSLEDKRKARERLVKNEVKKGRFIPLMFILSFFLIPSKIFAVGFEGFASTTNSSFFEYSNGIFTCIDQSALNYLATSTVQEVCLYTPPTMQELLVINTTILAFCGVVWLARLFVDVNPKKS